MSDEDTVEVAKMVLVGKVNKEIVLRLSRHGQPAVGLCGDDGSLFRVARRAAPGGEDIGFVGRIERVNVGVIEHVASDYIPVIASVGADREGHSYNVNADEAAGAVAAAIGAYKMVFLTDVPGWLADPADPQSLIGQATAEQVRDALPGLAGGMRPKLEACVDAINAGVSAAHILDGRIAHSLLLELFTDAGIGTKIEAAAVSLAELQELERTSVMASYARLPVEFVRGEGARLWDAEGNEYLDFLCGISVTSLGHCHPRVVEAVREQVGRLMHTSNLFYTEPAMRLAERPVRVEPAGARCSSATRARRPARRRSSSRARPVPGGDVVVVYGAFHGRTYGALSATPGVKAGAVRSARAGLSRGRRRRRGARGRGRRGTAAVLLEPIQGESGVHVLSEELLQAAREACDEHGAALVFDEVQCGMGRTGTLWAYEQTGVVPDAMTIAKALGGGLPIGALVTGERLADVLQPGDHGSTFAGGPVVAAAALAALELTDDPGLLADVREHGRRLAEGLERLPHVVSVRGRGLMLACELDVPAPEVVRRALLEQRLVINATGPTTVRLLPPLTIVAAEIDEALGCAALGGLAGAGARASWTAASSSTTIARIDADAVHAFISTESYRGLGLYAKRIRGGPARYPPMGADPGGRTPPAPREQLADAHPRPPPTRPTRPPCAASCCSTRAAWTRA